jgi:ABC-type amino acid transport substrate-binding protein
MLFSSAWASSAASKEAHPPINMLMQDSQPKYFLPNDLRKGLCVEIYRELKKRLEQQSVPVSISPKYLPIKRILKSVEINPNDIFCGAGRNAKREKRFIFSKTAVYHVSNMVAAHKDTEFKIDSFESIRLQHLTVGALYGTSSAAFVKSHEGVIVNDSFLDLKTGLRTVANKRIELFYYHDLGLNFLIKDWKLPLKVVQHKFRTVPQWVIYSKSIDPARLEVLERSLKDMESEGVIENIWKGYF